jgi:uncharacterized protein YbaR (Trm112 family)
MVSEELVEILACPETKQPVSLAEPAEIERLNQLVSQGKLVNRAGEKVEKPLDGGLVREDGKILYPIIEDIPVMLIEEGIPLKEG